jgi:hypothetical protein
VAQQRGTPPSRNPNADRKAHDAGAYIGRKPERVEETIPGGLSRKDERASAVETQTGAAAADEAPPSGHREGRAATDNTVREAGQDR